MIGDVGAELGGLLADVDARWRHISKLAVAAGAVVILEALREAAELGVCTNMGARRTSSSGHDVVQHELPHDHAGALGDGIGSDRRRPPTRRCTAARRARREEGRRQCVWSTSAASAGSDRRTPPPGCARFGPWTLHAGKTNSDLETENVPKQ
jgi:hypothetical protein